MKKILCSIMFLNTVLQTGGPPPPPVLPSIPGVPSSAYINWDNSIQVDINGGNFVSVKSNEFTNWIAQKPGHIIPANVQIKLPSGTILKYSDRKPYLAWVASGYDSQFVPVVEEEVKQAEKPGIKPVSAGQRPGGLDLNLGIIISNFRKYQATNPLDDPLGAEDKLQAITRTLEVFDNETYRDTLARLKQKPNEDALSTLQNLRQWILDQGKSIKPALEEAKKELEKKEKEIQEQLKKQQEQRKEKEQLEQENKSLDKIETIYNYRLFESIGQLQQSDLSDVTNKLNQINKLIEQYKDVLPKRGLAYEEIKSWSKEKMAVIIQRRNELGIKPPPKIFVGPPLSIPHKDWSRFPAGTKVTIKGSPNPLEFPTTTEKINSFIDDRNFLLNVGTVTTPEGTIFNFPLPPVAFDYNNWLKSLGVPGPEESGKIPLFEQPGVKYSSQELAQKLIDLEIELMILHNAL